MDMAGASPGICIFRMTTGTANDRPEPAAKRAKKTASPEPKQEEPGKKRQTFEYAHIPALYNAMRSVV